MGDTCQYFQTQGNSPLFKQSGKIKDKDFFSVLLHDNEIMLPSAASPFDFFDIKRLAYEFASLLRAF